MHEMSLAASVVESIEKEAVRQAFHKVERIVLEIGALSCVDPHEELKIKSLEVI